MECVCVCIEAGGVGKPFIGDDANDRGSGPASGVKMDSRK